MEREKQNGTSDLLGTQPVATQELAGPPPSMMEALSSRLGRAGLDRALQRRLQRRAAESPAAQEDPATLLQQAETGIRGAGGPLPHLSTIQQAFGHHDVSGITGHTDEAAARAAQSMGAEAFASGDQVAFAGTPSLHTAAHEAAHVVQQRAGVQLKGGVGEAGDAYEQHADAVADAVVKGQSAEALLDGFTGGGPALQHQALQRKDVATHYGTFKTTTFEKFGTVGVNCVLTFDPDPDKIDAKKLGLSQTIKMSYPDGSHTAIDPAKEGRRAKAGAGADYTLDRISTNNNPIYGAAKLGTGEGLDKTKADNNPTTDPTKVGPAADGGNATYQLGYGYSDGGGKKKQAATLYDRPAGGGGQMFETAALGLEGTDTDKYFGSVKWGFEAKTSDVDLKDIELASMGVPTQNYLAAAALWNSTKTRGTMEVTANPAKGKKASDMSDVDVPKGTKGSQIGEAILLAGKPAVQIQTLDGTHKYYVFVMDLKDTQDGGDNVKVPVPEVFVNPAQLPLFSDAKMTTKVKDLPTHTRMENTMCTVHGSYGVKLVDGPDLGLTGYVDQTKIKRE